MDSEIHPKLPTELILSVIDQVDVDDDLLLLARVSRHFHDLSLRTYFSRSNFDPESKNLSLNALEGSCRILSGLALYLGVVGTCLENLSYDFGYINNADQLIHEVHLLTRYVDKLSSIDNVSLRLATYFSGPSKGWRTASIILLQTISQKSCKNIHITTSQLSSFYEEPLLRSPKPSDWLKNYWPGEPPTTGTVKHLKVCFIQTFPAFVRPFYYHILRHNATVLTDLSFKNIFGGGSDWGAMISNVQFPRLSRLAIMYGVIPRDPLVKFLAKHPTIKDFEYHHLRYDPRPKRPARIDKSVFERLHTLTTTSEHILNFLPPMSRMSSLKNITVKIEELTNNFSALDGALRCLASCVNKITLSLEITRTGLGFGVWLDALLRNSSGKPEVLLHCVEALVMDNGDWGFADERIALRLPNWLRLFPSLRFLTLKVVENRNNNLPTFVEALKDACPGICIEWYHRQ